MTTLTPDQAEIIDLLRNEIAGMIESDSKVYISASADVQKEYLLRLENELEHFANACQLSGLLGLEMSSRHLSKNFSTLATMCPLNKEQGFLCADWAVHYLGYLNYLGDDNRELKQVNTLIAFLRDESWPDPITKDQQLTYRLHFGNSDLSYIAIDENKPPNEATEEMASLATSEDVRSELLSSMLVELPEQVRIFENSINSFVAKNCLEELSTARRMAHTVKGAANIVGIHGLANLMHFTEDLMEIAVKQNWHEMPRGFADLLLEASDCLAAISEYLTGIDDAPNNVQDTQQKLLNWIHGIRSGKTPNSLNDHTADNPEMDYDSFYAATQTLSQANELDPERKNYADPLNEHISELEAELDLIIRSCELESSYLPSPAAEESEVIEKEEDKHFIHFPERTAHDLLRIAGEVQIGNTQIATKVEAMRSHIRASERFHKKMRAMAAELEALVQMQSSMHAAAVGCEDDEIDPLEMERFSELHTFSNQLLELATDSHETLESVENELEELSELAYGQGKLNEDNQRHLMKERLVPVQNLSSRFSRCVRQACRMASKNASLDIEGADVMVDSRVLHNVAEPVMHLLRNAVDHGIEDSGVRKKLGKSPEGKITLKFSCTKETVTIECHDDGQGLNYEKIRKVAQQRKLINANDEADKSFLNQFIMLPGFTTQEVTSNTSGRGIGLDAVKASVRSLKGRFAIRSVKDWGCTATISVPSSLLSGHVLVVNSGGADADDQTLCLVSRNVEHVLYVNEQSLVKSRKGISYLHEGKNIPVYNLNDLTDIHNRSSDSFSALLILKKQDGESLGVAVDNIISSQVLVIKPLNEYTAQLPGVVGATILGDGTVSPVIDLMELPGLMLSQEEFARLRKQRQQIASLDSIYKVVQAPIAIIVDDSLSARRSLAQFVSDMGMEVYTAKDGIEAISILEKKTPTLMLIDLEMPRMNGLELTAHLRTREDTKNIPVIMITSRSTEKHRLLAKHAGVDTYIKKPWSEEELMATIHKEIA